MAERIEGLSIGLDLDSLKVNSGMTDLRSKLRLVNSEMKANLSAFDRADKSIDKHQVTLDGLNKKLTVQQAIVEKARRSYEKMTKEHGEGSIQAEKAAREFNNQSATLNNLERNIQRTTNELKDLRREQALNESSWTKLGQRIGETSNRLTGIGDKMQAVGRNMTLGVTAPLTAVGVAAVRTGMTFDKEMSKVRAISGSTGDQFNKMREQAIKLGADTSKSASEVAAGQLEMAKAGFEVNEIMAAMPGVIAASEASGADMTRTTEVMTTALNGFGLAAKDASRVADVLAAAANKTNADIDDLGYTFKYAAPVARSLGLSLEDVAAAAGIMADAGIKGEQAGTTLRTAMIRLAKPPKQAADALEDLGIKISDSNKKMLPLQNIIGQLNEKTRDMTGVQKSAALAAIFGTEAVSGMVAAVDAGPKAFGDLKKSLEESEGASESAAKVMKDNFAGAMEELLGTMESIGIQISDEMTPVIKDLTVWLTEMGEKFQNLSPEMKRALIITGLVAAGIGPLALGIGTLTKSIGFLGGGLVKGITWLGKYRTQTKLAAIDVAAMGNSAAIANAKMANTNANMGKSTKGMKAMQGGAVAAGGAMSMFGGKWGLVAGIATSFLPEILKGGKGLWDYGSKALGTSKNVGLLARGFGAARLGIGALTGPVGLGITGLTLLGEGGYKLYKHLKEEGIPVMNSFGNEVSNSTTKAVLGYKKLNDDATAELNELYWTGTTVSQKTSDEITGIFSRMGNKISSSLKADYDKSYGFLNEYFQKSKALTEFEEQNVLKNAEAKYLSQQEIVRYQEAKIKEIMTKASNEKRILTQAEKNQINTIQRNMMNTAVQTMSKGEVEQKIIMERLRSASGSITARQAAETVANSVKAKNGAVKEANDKYNKTLAAIIRERDETGTISAAQASKLIKEAEKTRKESVAKATDMHNKVVTQARLQAGGQANQIDWATGKVLTNWDKMIRGVAGAVNSISSGINGFLKALHVDARIPMWNPKGTYKPSSGKTGNASNKRMGRLEQYAKGTNSSGHPGGDMVVGDGGKRELIAFPNGRTWLSPATDTLVPNAPRGTQVLSGEKTKKLLGNVPKYADGVGDYFDLAMKGSKAVASHFWNKYGKIPKMGGIFSQMGTGIGALVKSSLQTHLKGKLKDIFDMGGTFKGGVAGPSQVRSWVTKALEMTGTSLSWLPAMMVKAQKESGYNPRAINLWDSNAKKGIPSKGLFQTIDPTFNAYKMRGMNDIYNPIHNAVAAIRYIKSRYGTVFNTPGMRSMARGGAYKGYETGGLINEDGIYRLAEGGFPEIVIPTDPSRRTDAMKLLALAGRKLSGGNGNKRPSQLPNVGGSNDSLMAKLLEATLEQNQILMRLLNKDISFDPRTVGEAVFPVIDSLQGSTIRLTR